MIRSLKSPCGVLVLLFFAVALSLTASVQATQIEYEKVDHPPKLEGVLARIQKELGGAKTGTGQGDGETIRRGRISMAKISQSYWSREMGNFRKYRFWRVIQFGRQHCRPISAFGRSVRAHIRA